MTLLKIIEFMAKNNGFRVKYFFNYVSVKRFYSQKTSCSLNYFEATVESQGHSNHKANWAIALKRQL